MYRSSIRNASLLPKACKDCVLSLTLISLELLTFIVSVYYITFLCFGGR